MYILELFNKEGFVDSAFAFDNLELEEEKRKIIHKAKKGDIIYISEMSGVYDLDTLVGTIVKMT